MIHIELGLAALDLLLVAVGYGVLYAVGCTTFTLDLRLVPLSFLVGWATLGTTLAVALTVGIDPSVPAVIVVSAVTIAICIYAGRRTVVSSVVRPGNDLSATLRARVRRARRSPTTLIVLGALVLAIATIAYAHTSLDVVDVALGLTAFAVAVIAYGARRRPAGSLAATIVTALAGAILAFAAFSALLTTIKGTWPAVWDAFLMWAPRGAIVYFHGLDPGLWRTVAHPEYPPLLAAMYAAYFHFAGGFHLSVIPMQNTLLAIGFVGGILALIDRHVPRWFSFTAFALLAVAPTAIGHVQTLLADPMLSYVVAAGAVSAFLWLATRESRWLVLSTIFLAAAVQTKLEGLADALLLTAVVLLTAFLRDGRRAGTGLVLLVAPALVIPWRLWLHFESLPASSPDYRAATLLHPVALDHRLSRLTAAVHYEDHQLFATGSWLIVLPIALVTLAIAAVRAPQLAGAAVGWLALAYAGSVTVYWVGTLEIQRYLFDSGDRIAAKLVIGAAALAPLVLGISLERGGSAAAGWGADVESPP